MTNLFTELSARHEEFLIEFISWYKTKKYTLTASQFSQLDTIFQLVIFHMYVHEKYNIGVLFDEYSVVLYWVKPDHKMAEKDILDRYSDTAIFTHVFSATYNMPRLKAEYAYKRAVNKAIDYIVEPY